MSDFGLSCHLSDKISLNRQCGTPGYIAPEVFEKKPFSIKSDIFSVGVLFYNLISGEHLFEGLNHK